MNYRPDNFHDNFINMSIGGLPFCSFPSSYLVANQLSTYLDVRHELAQDFRCFLQEMGLESKHINFLDDRYQRPTYEALVKGHLRDKSLGDIVDVLQRLDRDDCVGVIHKAIVDQIRRKSEEGFLQNNVNREDLGNTDIQTVLSFDCSRLLKPQAPRPIYAIGTQSEREIWNVICQHLRMIKEEIQHSFTTYIIRLPTDPGVKSCLLALTTTLARLILMFLVLNNSIIAINVLLPLWSSVHTFSIIEHLAVLMLVLSDWVLEPMICDLRDIVLEKDVRKMLLDKTDKKKKMIKKKKRGNWTKYRNTSIQETGLRQIHFIEERCQEEIKELEEKEKKQMKANRSTYFFIFPIQFVVFLAGIFIQVFDITDVSHNDHLFNCCLVILLLDFSVRMVLILMHYVTLNSTDRFNVQHDHLDQNCKKIEQYFIELYKEEQSEKMSPRKKPFKRQASRLRLNSENHDNQEHRNKSFRDIGVQVDYQTAPFIFNGLV